jgi:hypothetical protein
VAITQLLQGCRLGCKFHWHHPSALARPRGSARHHNSRCHISSRAAVSATCAFRTALGNSAPGWRKQQSIMPPTCMEQPAGKSALQSCRTLPLAPSVCARRWTLLLAACRTKTCASAGRMLRAAARTAPHAVRQQPALATLLGTGPPTRQWSCPTLSQEGQRQQGALTGLPRSELSPGPG